MKNHNTKVYSTPIQLKLPVDLERIIKINDPVYSFSEVMAHNNFAQRMPVVEEQIKVINHRIEDLEQFHKPTN